MRLDLILKYSRLVKRRTMAKEYCEKGLVFVNDKVGKPSTDVKDGDIIEVHIANKVIRIQVSLKLEGKTLLVGYDLVDAKEDNKYDA